MQPSLRELQALFWRALDGSVEPDLEHAVCSTPSFAAADRLGIYAGMYFGRLRDVLADDFQQTAGALGDGRFAETVRAYLAEHPSEHPSVRHLGRPFAAFLAARPVSGAPPWAPDLARLEWARVEVFDAPDAAPIGLADLGRVPAADWPSLRLRPIPALEVVESDWPLDQIWRDGAADARRHSALRVWRQEGAVYHCAMDAVEHEAMAGLRSGATFGEICEALGHLEPEQAAAEAGALLARWLDDGLIAGLS